MRRVARQVALIPGIALALAAAAAAADAQQRASLRGAVRAEGGAALEMAEVLLFGTQVSTRTDEAGAFTLRDVAPGKYFVGVRRLGFEPLVFTLNLDRGKEREITVELTPLPTTLSPVKIEAASDFNRARYADLLFRRRTAWGTFITRDDIERQRPYSVATLVASYLPGVSPAALESGGDFARAGRFAGYRSSYNCAPALSINGGTPMPGWPLNTFDPDEIEALEIYRGRSTRLPVQFEGPYSGCGVIVLWMRY